MAKDEKKVVKKATTKKETNKTTKTVKKDVKKDTKKKVVKEPYFKKVRRELKLVKWPSASEVVKYTISTIVFVAILCGVFMLLNLLLSIVKGWLV